MEEFRSVSFVVIDSEGTQHHVAINKSGHEHPEHTLRGDPAVLLKNWEGISKRVEFFLRGKIYEAGRGD